MRCGVIKQLWNHAFLPLYKTDSGRFGALDSVGKDHSTQETTLDGSPVYNFVQLAVRTWVCWWNTEVTTLLQ